MDFNKELIINNFSELEEGKNYLIQVGSDEYDGIYNYVGNTLDEHKFINLPYEISIIAYNQCNLINMYYIVKNTNTNSIHFKAFVDIFEIPTNEYVLK